MVRRLVVLAAVLATGTILVGCGSKPTTTSGGGAKGSTGGVGTIAWKKDLKGALAQAAQQQGKYVLVDFYTDWCGYCKKLDQETYPDPAVAAAITNRFIPVKINAEVDKDAASHYRVDGYPTIVIVDARGDEASRIVGFLPPREFLAELNKVK